MKKLSLTFGILLCACSSDPTPTPSGSSGAGPMGGSSPMAGSGTGGSTNATAGTGSGGGGADTQGGSAGSAQGGSQAGGGGDTAGGTAGADGGGSGGGGAGGPGASICPEGSAALMPTLPNTAPEGMSPPGAGAGNNLEGPVWIDGVLYASLFALSSVPPTEIVAYVPGMGFKASPFTGDAGTNGLAVDNQGNLVGALHKDGSISRFDLKNPSAAPTKLAFEYPADGANGEKKRFNSPNDLAVHSNGTIYFTDPDWQAPNPKPQGAERVYRVKDGTVQHLQGVTVQKPNGIVISVDEKSLYIGGSNGLFKYPLNADGTVGTEARVNVNEIQSVDGMTKDCAGHLYVTSGSSVVVLRPNDTLLGSIGGISGATNVAFGGADRKTLFVTSMQPPRLREIPVGIPGYPY